MNRCNSILGPDFAYCIIVSGGKDVMNSRTVMSPELVGILSVGVALAGLILLVSSWVGTSLRSLDARLDKVEQNVAVLLERTTPLAPIAVNGEETTR